MIAELTMEQKAVAIKMAMDFETKCYADYLMKDLLECLIKSPEYSTKPLLNFLRTATPTTARLYNEIIFRY